MATETATSPTVFVCTSSRSDGRSRGFVEKDAQLDDERPVTELAEQVGMSQPATSQHLKVLRDAGLVVARVDGPRRLYRADLDGLERLRAELEDFWPHALEALKAAAESGDWP